MPLGPAGPVPAPHGYIGTGALLALREFFTLFAPSDNGEKK
jgi:hypothetical protein